jgi:histidinol-phosphate aminotransferase
MTKYLSELAKSLEPYVPGEQPKDKKYVKLNTNENPYPPSQKVAEAIKSEIMNLRLYPDPDATAVRESAAAYYNKKLNLSAGDILDADNIFVGNGTDEVLALIFPAFFKGKKIAFADITYSFYPVYAALFEVEYEILPLTEDFSIDVEQYISGISSDVGGILLCNPNAPTGRLLGLEQVEKIAAANQDKLVVVDEAYIDFGGETAVSLVNRYENLLITQTLSKSRQLAGMRAGVAIGCHDLIAGINTVKNSFNSYTADRLAIAAASAAFDDAEYFDETTSKITATRTRITKELESLGFDVIPSGSNFIFAQPPAFEHSTDETDAGAMFRLLREAGVLVRYFNKPRINNRLRISIGTDEEMDTFMAAVKKIL